MVGPPTSLNLKLRPPNIKAKFQNIQMRSLFSAVFLPTSRSFYIFSFVAEPFINKVLS